MVSHGSRGHALVCLARYATDDLVSNSSKAVSRLSGKRMAASGVTEPIQGRATP